MNTDHMWTVGTMTDLDRAVEEARECYNAALAANDDEAAAQWLRLFYKMSDIRS